MIDIDLHPLALEDVCHGHSRNRSKADYYIQHLFLRVLCHQLVNSQEEEDENSSGTYTMEPRTTSPESMLGLEEKSPLKEVHGERTNGSSLSSNIKRTLYPLLPLNHADIHTIEENPTTQSSSTFTKLLKKEGDVSPKIYYQKILFFFMSTTLPTRYKQHARNTKSNKFHWML